MSLDSDGCPFWGHGRGIAIECDSWSCWESARSTPICSSAWIVWAKWLSASICAICASGVRGEARISSSLISSTWRTPSGSSLTSSKSGMESVGLLWCPLGGLSFWSPRRLTLVVGQGLEGLRRSSLLIWLLWLGSITPLGRNHRASHDNREDVFSWFCAEALLEPCGMQTWIAMLPKRTRGVVDTRWI